jgi:hypothetical protein
MPRNGIVFERILFVLGWLADARIGRFKVKLWRLTTREGSAASDGGSYNAPGGNTISLRRHRLLVDC